MTGVVSSHVLLLHDDFSMHLIIHHEILDLTIHQGSSGSCAPGEAAAAFANCFSIFQLFDLSFNFVMSTFDFYLNYVMLATSSSSNFTPFR